MSCQNSSFAPQPGSRLSCWYCRKEEIERIERIEEEREEEKKMERKRRKKEQVIKSKAPS
jgi:hypothetical protein